MKPSVAIVTKGLAPYRCHLYDLVGRHLRSYGIKVYLVVPEARAFDHPWKDAGGSMEGFELLEAGGRLGEEGWRRVAKRLIGAGKDFTLPNGRLFRILQEIDPALVWVHEYSPFCLFPAFWASFRERASVLSTEVGDSPPAYACSPMHLQLQKGASFLYEGVIAHTREATRRSTRRSGEHVVFAPHAIDTDLYRPAHPEEVSGKFRFLFVGGLLLRKGLDSLIEAAGMLAAKGIDFELRVVGTGPLASWLEERKEPWLQVVGFREGEALREEYRTANVFVLPTRQETYGVVVHEAAASGLALLVGRDAGSVETLVEDGISGFAIDPENPAEIADRMEQLAADPRIASRMGGEARRLAERYDIKKIGADVAGFLLPMIRRELAK